MISDYLYPTRPTPTWNGVKLKEYLRIATNTPQQADAFHVSENSVLTVVLSAVQYSALSQHFFATEGSPTVLHPGPYKVQYSWICQGTFAGAVLTLTQDQRARDVYTLTMKKL